VRIVIPTDDLILRPFSQGDASIVARLAGDDRVSRTTLNIPHLYSIEMARTWIGVHPKRWSDRDGAVFAIAPKATNEVVGTVSLVSITGTETELGYWIGYESWNKGYCSEAAHALVQYAFDHMGITRVFAEHLSSNPASERVMTNIGMTHIGQSTRVDRKGENAAVENYEMLKKG
jgi:ribosomal-protein-alanine N-acetyltransferase